MENVPGEVIRCNAHLLNLAVQDSFDEAQQRGIVSQIAKTLS